MSNISARTWALLCVMACAPRPDAASAVPAEVAPAKAPTLEPELEAQAQAEAAPETTLGVRDAGIFSDVEPRLQLAAPEPSERAMLWIDERRSLVVLYVDDWPRKVYPLGGASSLRVGSHDLRLRPGDRAELARFAGSAGATLAGDAGPAPGDHDRDGIPDPLDVLIGAHKAALNGDAYDDRYFTLSFPNGDPPRDRGACVDVIVRATRNAGLDLQSEVFADVRGAPSLYGSSRPDPNIDHRRVRTVLVYFRRHWQTRSAELDDARDPLRLGDVVLLDTFPDRPGPDHIGVVSELTGDSGQPLIINNWTFGYTTRPMDLLGSIPVTHRFRFPSAPR